MNPDLLQSTLALTQKVAVRRGSTPTEGQFANTTIETLPGWGSTLAGSGRNRPRPFAQDNAIRWFGGVVYTMASLNAKAFASVPLRMYVRRGQGRKLMSEWKTRPVSRSKAAYLRGGKSNRPSVGVMQKVASFGDEYEELTTPHPALKVLSAANEWQNGFDLSYLRCLYKQVTGNAYLYPVIGPLGVPSELWVAPSQLVTIIPSVSGNWIDGYRYGRKGHDIVYGPNDLIHFRYPSLSDPLYGAGKVEMAWTALQVHWAKRQNDIAMFENGARPDWLLIVKQGGSTGDLDRIEAAVDSKFRGPRKAGQFLAVSGDVDAKPLQLTPKDIGDYEDILEEICSVFGVPISKLKASDPTYSNAETADNAWLRDTILPECRSDEEQLNARYLPLFGIGQDAFLAYDDPVPENEQVVIDNAVKKYAGGLLSLNEVRQSLGDQPVPDDQDLRVAPLGAMLVNPGVPAARVAPTPTVPDPEDVAVGTQVEKGIKRGAELVPNPLDERRRAEDARRREQLAGLGLLIGYRPIAGQDLIPGIAAAFQLQQQQVTSGIVAQASRNPHVKPTVNPMSAYTAGLASMLIPALLGQYRQAATRAAGEIGLPVLTPETSLVPGTPVVDVSGLTRIARNQIIEQATEAARLVNETTQTRVQAAIDDAWEEIQQPLQAPLGEGAPAMLPSQAEALDRLREAVDRVFEQAIQERAPVIAEHEALKADTAGSQAVAESAADQGVKIMTEWALGPKPCIDCVRIKRGNPDFVAQDSYFINPADMQPVYPPVHPRCQCTLVQHSTP